jgi:signal transduction histidine kinase
MDVKLSTTNLFGLIENSLVMIREKALKHDIAVDLQATKKVRKLILRLDERRVKQIMFNLLSNAAKFTPDGGSISVDVRMHGPSDVVVSVSDTGIGIDPKDQKKIFETFEQATEPMAGKPSGTGLGLPITKQLVEMHGGRIWLESEGKGKGCRFSFTLPIQTQRNDNKEVV